MTQGEHRLFNDDKCALPYLPHALRHKGCDAPEVEAWKSGMIGELAKSRLRPYDFGLVRVVVESFPNASVSFVNQKRPTVDSLGWPLVLFMTGHTNSPRNEPFRGLFGWMGSLNNTGHFLKHVPVFKAIILSQEQSF
jgi:hypothetical protein